MVQIFSILRVKETGYILQHCMPNPVKRQTDIGISQKETFILCKKHYYITLENVKNIATIFILQSHWTKHKIACYQAR